MFRLISPSALAMLMVVLLTLSTALVYEAEVEPTRPAALALPLAEADPPELAVGPAASRPPAPRSGRSLGSDTAPEDDSGPDTDAAPAPAEPLPPADGKTTAPVDLTEFTLAPLDFSELETSPEGISSTDAAPSPSPTPAATPTPEPTPAPAPEPPRAAVAAPSLGGESRDLVYPVGAAGEVTVRFNPRGMVAIGLVAPADGWEVRNLTSWKKGLKVLLSPIDDPTVEATIVVEVIDRLPVATVNLPR